MMDQQSSDDSRPDEPDIESEGTAPPEGAASPALEADASPGSDAASEAEVSSAEASEPAAAQRKPKRSPMKRKKAKPVVAGVRFKRAGRIYYFDARSDTSLAVGDRVIVETAQGLEAGEVVIAPGQVMQANLGKLKPIRRRATWEDLNSLVRQREKEPEALAAAVEQIARHRLPMRAVAAEYTFDGSGLTIYFTSDKKRVDFRALVRDLARSQHTRVLLRQVGPRDKAKLLGGIDRCGRELCCSSWMPEFQPISIRMAKTQGLPLNPAEISGVCGKLLCCLSFEDEQYRDMRTGMPKMGARLTSAVGRGKVVDVNLLTRKVTVSWEDGSRVVVDGDEFKEQRERWQRAFGESQEQASEQPKSAQRRPRGKGTDSRRGKDRDGTRSDSPKPKRGGEPATTGSEGSSAAKDKRPAGATGKPESTQRPDTDGQPKPKPKRRRRRKRSGGARSQSGAPREGAKPEDKPQRGPSGEKPAKAEGEKPAGARRRRRRGRRRRRKPDGGGGEGKPTGGKDGGNAAG